MEKSAVYDELKRSPKNVCFNRYAIEIFYSEEDEGYIAVAPELPECSAFGENEEDALKEIKGAIDLWKETAKKDRREIPKPNKKELMRNFVEGLTGFKSALLKIKLFLGKQLDEIKLSKYKFINLILYLFIAFFVIYLLPLLIGNEYEQIIKIAEFTIIGSGTLTILTFTYALVKEEKKEDIVLSGELLFKSTLTFIMGLGLLPGVGLMLRSPTDIVSKLFGNFSWYYDTLVFFITVLILIIGIISLMLSATFFAKGITKLIELLQVY